MMCNFAVINWDPRQEAATQAQKTYHITGVSSFHNDVDRSPFGRIQKKNPAKQTQRSASECRLSSSHTKK